jgi:hypothetical protein
MRGALQATDAMRLPLYIEDRKALRHLIKISQKLSHLHKLFIIKY